MRVIIALVAFAALFGIAQAAKSVCTASGDPHYTTFDGVKHDFMGEGSYQFAKTEQVEVQCQLQLCRLVRGRRISCIRSCTGKFTFPRGPTVSVKFGSWGRTFDKVIIHGQDLTSLSGCESHSKYDSECNLSAFNNPVEIMDGLYTIQYVKVGRKWYHYRLKVVSTVEGNDAAVHFGPYFVYIAFPHAPSFLGESTGLCGFFDGSASNDFTDFNGTLIVPNTIKYRRYNGADVNQWGASYAVDDNNIAPVLNHFHNDMQEESFVVPMNVVPTSEEQANITEVTYANNEALQTATDACRAAVKEAAITDVEGAQRAFEDCMYDYAATDDADEQEGFAGANVAAQAAVQNANQQNSPTGGSSGTSDGEAAGIAVGVIAGAALIVAGVMYFRLQRARKDYSRALVLVNGGSNNDIQLSNNL